MTKRFVAPQAYIAEAIDTFTLVFAGTGAMIVDDITGGEVTHVGVALTFGLVVMVMIYTLGNISGAHINPAVTVGFWCARCFPSERVLPYIASQMIGAILASTLLRLLFPTHTLLGMTVPTGPTTQSFVLEIVLTFLLMFVIACAAMEAQEKALRSGVAIGAIIGLEALFAGPISGASMNPARSLGPAIVPFNFSAQWIYVVAPLVGAALAAVVYQDVSGAATRERPYIDSGANDQPVSALHRDRELHKRS